MVNFINATSECDRTKPVDIPTSASSKIPEEFTNSVVGTNQNNENYEQIENEEEDECVIDATVADSNNVHIGSNIVYHGPVTIKQIVYTNNIGISNGRELITDTNLENNSTGGIVNLAFETDNKDIKECNSFENNKPTKTFSFLKNEIPYSRKILFFAGIIAACIFILVILLIFLLPTYTRSIDAIMVTREQWNAQPPKENLTELPVLPVPCIIVHHTATENCSTKAACILITQRIQEFHMGGRNWSDIGYNFLVGGDGKVYYGRGWISQGAHTYGFNYCLGVAFIGTFKNIKPTERQYESFKNLIGCGIYHKYIREDYSLLGARQLHSTSSPGDELYNEIKTWSHWSSTPPRLK